MDGVCVKQVNTPLNKHQQCSRKGYSLGHWCVKLFSHQLSGYGVTVCQSEGIYFLLKPTLRTP